MNDNAIKEGYKRSEETTKVNAKTFYFCSLSLRKEKRLAAYSVYAFSRMLDDVFDTCSDAGLSDIATWRNKLSAVYAEEKLTEPALLALRETVKKYDIPSEYFHELIKGMEMDLSKKEYRDFSELYKYCYRVAGVIGLIMAKIFGYSEEKALLYAEKMGIAMQLTNILRDIKEDLDMGRLYLPQEELNEYDITLKDLENGVINDNFVRFMRFQIDRARSFYKEAYSGLGLIKDPNPRFIAKLMGTIYSGILDSIEKNSYDVFSKRNYVPLPRKILLFLKALFGKDD